MKKISTLFLALLAVAAMQAKTVTIDCVSAFTGKGTSGTGGEVTYTQDGVTFTCDKAYGDGDYGIRCYKGATITIEAEETISKIAFNFPTVSGTYYNGGLDAIVNPNATSWTSGVLPSQARLNGNLIITLGAAEKVDTLNVSEMIALIDGAEKHELSKEAYVIGVVGGISSKDVATYGNISVWMADIRTANATDTIEAFRMKNFKGAAFKDVEDITFGKGDTIVVYGTSWLLYEEEGKKSQYEAAEGCFLAEVIGEGHPEPIVYEEINVAQALEIGGALEAGAKTPVKYDVRGYVASISSTKGLEKIYLADDPEAYGEFQAYQCEIADGANVEEGSFVSVVGYIEKFQYQGAEPTDYTIEISKGKLTVIDPTALPTVIAEKVSCKKMMINGQMYIKNGKKLYNVLGQAL